MRARLAGILLATAAALTVSPFAELRASAETSTTTTAVDPLATSTTSTSTSTTTSTTTTTMPSAVTTVPEGCALPPEAQAVFVGQLVKTDPVTATFNVTQMRAGSLEGYSAGAVVEVRYGADVKFLEAGESYIVGVALDPVTQKLSSTVKDPAELFGGNEVAGGGVKCPVFEAAARTLHTDGTAVDSGVFSNILGEPLRLFAALVIPSGLVFVLLLALVWVRRGLRR